MLNPDAPEFAPVPACKAADAPRAAAGGAPAAAAAAAATPAPAGKAPPGSAARAPGAPATAAAPITIRAAAGRPPSIATTAAPGAAWPAAGGAPPAAPDGGCAVTPNGLAELATILSGDLSFDEMFSHGSRGNSLAEPLETPAADAADAAAAPPAPLFSSAARPPLAPAWPPLPGGAALKCDSAASLASVASTVGSSGSDAAAVEQARHELLCDGPVQSCAATGMPPSTRVGPRDFDILRVVGQGAFGKVFQVRHRGSGRLYAMKVMRKERILQRDHGDYGVFDEDVARLYTAEIVCAISYLHARGIVHRDLKPENVLLDCEGHVKLTDFGLAKGNMDAGCRTNSFIGTMEYMAPEIIDAKGHDKGVDWWSTGILLYEMLAGVPPFRAKSRQALQQQITGGKIKWPKFLSPAALALLRGLLTRDPEKRLGAGPGGSAEIRAHPFFKSINWTALEERRVPSSFKPAVSHSLSVENFDKMWTEQNPEDSPCGTPTDPGFATAFEGFTYVSPSFMAASMAAITAARRGGGAA
ncbi:serine threonine kinase [Raphidocelis subcapitata]|uniref:Serine threonine kinase n=1 Tax=Raphidocelis subcapitata TaxID=307507 RepID=A0A2V0P5S2_9CHLO|nr:serine threonine kinase [Raphidocelis subcapitata]|eukprot:GBF95208.1 serine threonine kinase [Raphidocelis subcapitata]